MKKYLLTLAAIVVSLTAMADNIPAFPGAEGHGRYVTGGRGAAKVIHVTNLNDKGTGSLRAAVSGSAKKIVVFDVGGVIPLASELTIGANTTILGQTAPEPGITLRYYTVRPNGNNIIMRFIRIRRGEEKDINDGADATWARNFTGIILDHCSFSWSIDEIASFYDNRNFTMQWCTIGEALANPGHSKGEHSYGGIWGGKGASFHHNFLCHMQNRVPRFCGARYGWDGYDKSQYSSPIEAEIVDFRNCVMYNWGNGNGCYGGTGGGNINIVNNYYKAGPATSNKTRVTQVSVATSSNASGSEYMGYCARYYINGNYVTAASSPANYDWKGVIYDSGTVQIDGEKYCKDTKHLYGDKVTYKQNATGEDCVSIKLGEPVATGEVTTHTAQTAYEKVLANVGASLYRDAVDTRYIDEATNGKTTYTGTATKTGDGNPITHLPGIIDFVKDQGTYELASTQRETGFDTDQDGIPDAWETANGLNPNSASDAMTYTLDPAKYYTNLEVYANSLVQDIMLAGNSDADSAAKEYYPAYKKADGTSVEAVNTLGLDLNGETQEEPTEEVSYNVSFNTEEKQSTDGYFTFGDSSNKHNLNGKFTGKYNGTEYAQGLKMEGSTLIQFTNSATATIIIVQSDWESSDVAHGTPKTLKFDGTELDISSAEKPSGSEGVLVYTITGVSAGKHTITRGSGESGVFYVEVRESVPTGIQSTAAASSIVATEYYSLDGRKFTAPQRGINIQVMRKADGSKQTRKVVMP